MSSYIWLYFKNAQPDLALKYLKLERAPETPIDPSGYYLLKTLPGDSFVLQTNESDRKFLDPNRIEEEVEEFDEFVYCMYSSTAMVSCIVYIGDEDNWVMSHSPSMGNLPPKIDGELSASQQIVYDTLLAEFEASHGSWVDLLPEFTRRLVGYSAQDGFQGESVALKKCQPHKKRKDVDS